MSSQPKTIAIIGATGTQGGSVLSTFQASGWHVRALTRNTSSPKALSLSKLPNVQVLRADLDDPSTLTQAFRGAQVVFAVSDFWGIYGQPESRTQAEKEGKELNVWTAQRETQQLKNVVDALAGLVNEGLERLVFSSLSHVTKWSKGKYTNVLHFDSKALAEEYAKEKYPDLWAKTDVFQIGFYVGNFVLSPMLAPVKTPEGLVQFSSPTSADTKLPFVAAEEDAGPIVKAMVEDPQAGKNVLGYRELISMSDLVQRFSEATGMKAEYVVLPHGQTDPRIPVELKAEFVDNFAYFNDFGYDGGDPSIVHPTQLKYLQQLGSVSDYLAKQDWAKVFA